MSDLFGHDPASKPPGVYELLRAYDDAYRRRYGVPASIVRKKDGALAARLLKIYTFENLYDWVALFFLMPDAFFQRSGHTFGTFSGCIAQIIAHASRIRAATIERQPITPEQVAHVLAVRKQMADNDAADAAERAAAWYKERPWLSH